MKTNSLLKSTAAITVTLLLTLGSAQAGMGPCPLGSGNASPGCASQSNGQQACQRPGNPQGSSCAVGSPELAGMVGNMAAGGMEIAANVMGTLINQASRVVGSGM